VGNRCSRSLHLGFLHRSAPEWNVFISYAREDKENIAQPLAEALESKLLRVEFDEFTLNVGDDLCRSIDGAGDGGVVGPHKMGELSC
jgi:hypothetical protein